MSTLDAIRGWRPKTPFYYGWLVLAMCALGTFAGTGISQVVLGGIQGFIFEDTGWTRSTLALGVSIGTWSGGLTAPIVGRLADRYGPRWLMPIGLVIVGISFFWLAGVHSVWQFYVAYTVGRAVSNPVLIGVVPRTAAVNFFRRQRNISLALTGMFRPVSGAINIQIISAIAVAHSWRTAYRYLGVLSFVLVLPLALVLRRRPEDIGLLPDGELHEGSPLPGGAGPRPALGGAGDELSWPLREVLGTRTFWLIGGTAALVTLGSSTIGFSIVPYLNEEAGLSIAQAAGVLSLSTALSVSSLGWAVMADRFTPKVCLVVALVATASAIFYLLTVGSLVGAYGFSLIWGVSTAAIGVLEHMMLAQYFGRGSYGSIIGTLGPLQTGALGLGPTLGAWVRDLTKSYRGIQLGMAAVFLCAALLVLLIRPPGIPRSAATQDEPKV